MVDSLRFKKLHKEARLPTRGSQYAAGLDLYSVDDIDIPNGGRAAVRTGLAVAIPPNFYGRVAPRSGLSINHGIDVLAGVIDSDYRGEIICVLINLGETLFHVERGCRVARLIVEPIIRPQPEWVEELDVTKRGTGGLGNTRTNYSKVTGSR